MKKLLLLALIVVFLTTPVYAELGGTVGVEYSTIREQVNWVVGANYTFEDRVTLGFEINHWTVGPFQSNTFPFVGFAPTSTYYLWFVDIALHDNVVLNVERYCEHWMAQSELFEDYVGVNVSLKYEF